VVEQGVFAPLGDQVARKPVGDAHPVSAAALHVGGVLADIVDEQVDQAVAVVVEEGHAGWMARVRQASLRGDVLEMAFAVVLEHRVTGAHGADVEVHVAVVVDIGKRGGDRNAVGQARSRLGGDVLELAAAEVLPELVSAQLWDEIDIDQVVAIDIGRGHVVAVVVVHLLRVFSSVIHDAVQEVDAGIGKLVGEAKVMKDLEAPQALLLGVLSKVEVL
jgi:hypothetical protein